jgi:putative ABC transport system substrate-binding protein
MLRSILTLLSCLATLAAFVPPAFAYDRITVLVGNSSNTSDEFIREFKGRLGNRSGRQFSVRDIADPSAYPMDQGTLIVAVGVQALQHAARQGGNHAVLGVLIPQPAFEKISASVRNDNFSAILLDQPPSRQMRLLHRLLPKAKNVGILLGPTSTRNNELLTRAATDSDLKAIMATIQRESDLSSALKPLLELSDALLAVPDPVVHQPGTAQTLLLTSYRYQKPVIGYSQAYVAAGALAAVYSSPADIARQAAEIADQFPERQKALPPLQPPRYFSVGINRQVARSLGLDLQDAESLTESLIKEEQ